MTKSRSLTPTRTKGKVEQEESNALNQLTKELASYHAEVFDGDFTVLSTDSKCERLDRVTKWLQSALVLVETFEERAKFRKQKTTQSIPSTMLKESKLKDQRNGLRECLRTFNAKICALYAPLIPEHPIEVDAGEIDVQVVAEYPC